MFSHWFRADKSLRRRIGALIPRGEVIDGDNLYPDVINIRVSSKIFMTLYEIQNFDYDIESRLTFELKYGE